MNTLVNWQCCHAKWHRMSICPFHFKFILSLHLQLYTAIPFHIFVVFCPFCHRVKVWIFLWINMDRMYFIPSDRWNDCWLSSIITLRVATFICPSVWNICHLVRFHFCVYVSKYLSKSVSVVSIVYVIRFVCSSDSSPGIVSVWAICIVFLALFTSAIYSDPNYSKTLWRICGMTSVKRSGDYVTPMSLWLPNDCWIWWGSDWFAPLRASIMRYG